METLQNILLDTESQVQTGVLTIHATHRDFFFFLQKVNFLVIMYNFPLKNILPYEYLYGQPAEKE